MTGRGTIIARVGNGQHFGQLLRQLREAAGLRAVQLADRLDVTPSLIGMRERHTRRLTVDDAVQVLNTLGYRLVVMPASLAPLDETRPDA